MPLRRRFAIALSTVALFMSSPAGPAVAVSGTGYDHTDPAATGCNRNAFQITPNIQLKRLSDGRKINAYMQIFYSRSCGTNWVRLTRNPYCTAASKWLAADLTGTLEGDWRTDEELDTTCGASYGMQMYAPGRSCITTSVQIYDSRARTSTSRVLARAEKTIC